MADTSVNEPIDGAAAAAAAPDHALTLPAPPESSGVDSAPDAESSHGHTPNGGSEGGVTALGERAIVDGEPALRPLKSMRSAKSVLEGDDDWDDGEMAAVMTGSAKAPATAALAPAPAPVPAPAPEPVDVVKPLQSVRSAKSVLEGDDNWDDGDDAAVAAAAAASASASAVPASSTSGAPAPSAGAATDAAATSTAPAPTPAAPAPTLHLPAVPPPPVPVAAPSPTASPSTETAPAAATTATSARPAPTHARGSSRGAGGDDDEEVRVIASGEDVDAFLASPAPSTTRTGPSPRPSSARPPLPSRGRGGVASSPSAASLHTAGGGAAVPPSPSRGAARSPFRPPSSTSLTRPLSATHSFMGKAAGSPAASEVRPTPPPPVAAVDPETGEARPRFMMPTLASRARLVAHGRPLASDATETEGAGYFAAAAADAVLPEAHDENAVLTRTYSHTAVTLATKASAANMVQPDTMLSRTLSRGASMVIRGGGGGGGTRGGGGEAVDSSGPMEPIEEGLHTARTDATDTARGSKDGEVAGAAASASPPKPAATSPPVAPGRGRRAAGGGVASATSNSRASASAASSGGVGGAGGTSTSGPAWGRSRAVGTTALDPSSRLYDPAVIQRRRASVEVDRERLRIASSVFGGSADWYERATRARQESVFRKAEIMELRAARERERAYIAARAREAREEADREWQWEKVGELWCLRVLAQRHVHRLAESEG